jgi:hypothetical protein
VVSLDIKERNNQERRQLAAAAVALGALLGAGSGVAFADTPTQAVQQVAGTGQSANSSASSTQVAPSNSAISVRIGSPGNDGSVSQSNDSQAGALAGNLARTTQDASQQSSGGGATQAADQAAKTEQSANAGATSTQVKPSNSAISVRIGSPGDDGDVSQSNSSAALAKAGNAADTSQTATQDASGGCGCGGGSTQAADQSAKTEQSANADATSKQIKPSNSAISVRIGSGGNNGSVDQSNSSAALAKAGNAADTTQTATQDPQGGSCGCGGGATQAADQSAKTKQSANADADSTQVKPSNSAISVRIGSSGDDGDVSQSNSSEAGALAGNAARTDQSADQEAGPGSGSGTQASDQEAATLQRADSDATSKQIHPSNDATSVRIGSPGNGGSVDQSNSSAAFSLAGNAAHTTQDATQDPRSSGCGCDGGGVQAAGQFAFTGQSADSSATSEQIGASNSATSVRLGNKDHKDGSCGCEDHGSPYGMDDGHGSGGSFGDDGSVSQSNSSDAFSAAGNLAKTDQTADQEAGSGSGSGVQAIDQEAATLQGAESDATSKQIHPSNDATSVRIGSSGGNGSVDQSNTSAALSFAGNAAHTTQDASQDPHSSHCGCEGDQVQAAGQFAFTGQWAGSNATSEQVGPSNSATSVRLGHEHGSPCGCDGHGSMADDGWTGQDGCGCGDHGSSSGGDNGSVSQTNASAALSGAFNKASTDQSSDQAQGSDDGCGCAPTHESVADCGCSGAGVQAVGQFAKTLQWAGADAHSAQYGASNSAKPVRIGSGGSNGSVEQTNASLAKALAFNAARTDQSVRQLL